MQQKQAIACIKDDRRGFISPIFVVPKADGSWRPVINLQALNTYVARSHFKMESIKTVKGLLQRGDWLVKLDLKDAYLTIPIHRAYRKYLRFRWQGHLWEFKVLPFGLSSAPFVFTKIMKPVVAVLRKLGVKLILYLDDMLVIADGKKLAETQAQLALNLLASLGFLPNLKKSVLTPTQQITFLGFNLDSNKMIISLPSQKVTALKKQARELLIQDHTSVRELSQILGSMVAAHPAVLPAPLHFRHLERAKLLYMRRGCSLDQQVPILQEMRSDLKWWANMPSSSNGRPLQIPCWDITIEADASKVGWGASCQGSSTGGPWTLEEQAHHINYLELKAAFLGLRSFCANKLSISVLLRLDNITAITFLNKMGGPHSTVLSDLASQV